MEDAIYTPIIPSKNYYHYWFDPKKGTNRLKIYSCCICSESTGLQMRVFLNLMNTSCEFLCGSDCCLNMWLLKNSELL